ncbi:MAG TPA: S8 family serine peptidase [Terriglobia bacterium]|nr:S8 family serine peptidase [Terriglobia bacterium]
MKKQQYRIVWLLAILTLGVVSSATPQGNASAERVLIRASRPFDRVTAAVQAAGGRVTHQYKYVDAIAAEVPRNAMTSLRQQIGSAAMVKDIIVSASPVDRTHGRKGAGSGTLSLDASSGAALPATGISSFAATHPGAYVLNFAGTRLDEVHALGLTGAGTIVAVIDSGIRPQFIGLGNSIVGGEDFVGDGLGYSNVYNDPHGTFVAGLITNNAVLAPKSRLLKAISDYAPGALDNGALTLLGAAPESQIYALRVFGVNSSAGARLSVVLAAMERVIDLRAAYNFDGSGVNIAVCNMSYGVTTLEPGASLLDEAADAMLSVGVVPVASAGDAGSATLTASSPGSSRSALAVGASSAAINERIGEEAGNKVGFGGLFRPFSGTQTAWFSSRGPNADGRLTPQVVASGVYNFSQGYCSSANQWNCPDTISLNSGTSFSAPIASGIAALLREAAPGATATEIRNALALTGRPSLLQDGSGTLDRGAGLVDALGALQLVLSGHAPKQLPNNPAPNSDVRINIKRSTDLQIFSGAFTQTINGLKPGQRMDLLFDVKPGTSLVTVALTQITPALKPADQNKLYGDGLFVGVHSAKTSAIGAAGDYLVNDLPRSPVSYAIANPDTGLMRISINGDTVNAGAISTTVTVTAAVAPLPPATASGVIHHGETLSIPLHVPPGVGRADFLLSWTGDWSHYPVSDVDLILVPPAGAVNMQGVSLAAPERVSISSPPAGDWIMQVDGFNIPSGQDQFALRVSLDGVPVN